jgi:hypothetical protein
MKANFNDAQRRQLEADLRCPRCGGCNRPGVHSIHIGDDGIAICDTCSAAFHPTTQQ